MKSLFALLGACVIAQGAESISINSYGQLTYPTTFWQINDDGFTKAIDRRFAVFNNTYGMYGANILRGHLGAAQAASGTELFYLNFYGDSWIHGSLNNSPTWYEVLVNKVKSALGTKWAGYGYLPATSGASPGQVPYPRLVPVTYTSNWVATGISTVGRGPSPMHMNATNNNSIITWTFPDAVPVKINIIYAKATGGGEFSWRFNHADDTNAWSAAISTDAADSIGVESITSGFPASAPFTLDIISTNCSPTAAVRICGIFHLSGTNGLVMNNLACQAASIKKYNDWVTNTTTWITAFDTGLEVPTTANRVVNVVSLGTNDILDSTTNQFVSRLNSFIETIEDADGTDGFENFRWVIVQPCETDRGNGVAPYPTRVTAYFPAAAGYITDRVGGDAVPVINADNWFGNSPGTSMIQWLDGTGGLHLNHYGAAIFAAHMAEYLGL